MDDILIIIKFFFHYTGNAKWDTYRKYKIVKIHCNYSYGAITLIKKFVF